MAYSMAYRKRAVEYREEGHTFKQLREVFGIPSESYYDRKEKFDSGYYETAVKRERRRKIDKEQLKQAVTDRLDAFLKEYAEQFGCTATVVLYALEKLGITRKKSLSPITNNQWSSGRNTARR